MPTDHASVHAEALGTFLPCGAGVFDEKTLDPGPVSQTYFSVDLGGGWFFVYWFHVLMCNKSIAISQGVWLYDGDRSGE